MSDDTETDADTETNTTTTRKPRRKQAARREAMTQHQIADLRSAYEHSDATQREICARAGITTSTLAYHARRNAWRRPASLQRITKVGASGKRAQLINRLYRAFERQVRELERRLGERLDTDPAMRQEQRSGSENKPDKSGGAIDDRDVKLLATLAQTLHRLVALDGAQAKNKAVQPDHTEAGGARTGSNDGDADLDAFRSNLARRLEALIEAPDRSAAGEPGS